MTTIKMLAPGQDAGMNVTAVSGNAYTSDASGLISVALNDVNSLENAGFIPLGQTSVITLALSTAAGVYVVPGVCNLIPVSTIAAVCLLPAPTTLGQVTRLVAASTGNFVITSSGCSLLTEKAASATVFTCTTGTADILSVGSTLYQIINRSIVSNTSAAVVYGIASS